MYSEHYVKTDMLCIRLYSSQKRSYTLKTKKRKSKRRKTVGFCLSDVDGKEKGTGLLRRSF